MWVPDAAPEALRDVVRAREDAKQDPQRARQRLGKFLLRHGGQPPADVQKKWTAKYMTWLHDHMHFAQRAAETGSLSGFQSPRQLMNYSGLVSSDYSSGNRIQRGGVTKTGNARLRRVMVEAA